MCSKAALRGALCMAKQSLNLCGCGKPATGRGKICNEGVDTILGSQHGPHVYLQFDLAPFHSQQED